MVFENMEEDESISQEDLIKQKINFCSSQIEIFLQRTNLDPLNESEQFILPALATILNAFEEGDANFQRCLQKSDLLNSLAKLVAFFAMMSDIMIKNLSKACALETLLSVSQKAEALEVLAQQLEMDQVPVSVTEMCECRDVVLEHPRKCECLECIEGEAAVAQEAIPKQFRKPGSNSEKAAESPLGVNENLLMMECGLEGTIVWPHRCLQFHKAAICCVSSFWSLLEYRSGKIAEYVQSLENDPPLSSWFRSGQMVVVATKTLAWISYEPTSPTAPTLPEFVRAFVLTSECPLPLRHGYRALWLPDYAARALCKPDRLIPLKVGSEILSWKSLVYIGSAHPPPPNEVLSYAVRIIFLMLEFPILDDLLIILDAKGPWRSYQLIKCVEGHTRVEYLAILNMLASHNEKGNRGLISCCIHNFLADWLVWLIHTKLPSDLELSILMDGINLYLPRIEVKRWTKSRLVYGATNALLKCPDFESIHSKLSACIQTLSWDNRGMFAKGYRSRPRRMLKQEGDEEEQKQSKPLEEKDEVPEMPRTEKRSGITIINKQNPGETWLLPTRPTLGLFIIPDPVLDDAVARMTAKCPTMYRGHLKKEVVQGLHCEVMRARGIRDIRQPAFSKIVCGMLNAGGGDIWVGLGAASKVDGVLAHRSERDSFAQGVLDVATYNIEPRLLPFNMEIQQILVLDRPGQELNPDRNRYAYKIMIKPMEGVRYLVLPEKAYLSRREPDGATVVISL